MDRADGVDDLAQQPRSPGERAAVLVVAVVGGRRQEATDDRRMRALQLDAVEAAGHAALGHGGVALHDGGDLEVVDRFGHLSKEGVGDGARRPHGRREYIPEACPPLWLIWAKTGTPWACTASVMRR